jgi:hypothetical protein
METKGIQIHKKTARPSDTDDAASNEAPKVPTLPNDRVITIQESQIALLRRLAYRVLHELRDNRNNQKRHPNP